MRALSGGDGPSKAFRNDVVLSRCHPMVSDSPLSSAGSSTTVVGKALLLCGGNPTVGTKEDSHHVKCEFRGWGVHSCGRMGQGASSQEGGFQESSHRHGEHEI